ncbi:MAG: TMEM175 family protein [Candidatus Bathyarchaeota archaeon]|nr:TMEM175 family protein [Candidatus Bathyarchaeum tardum]
MKAPHPSDQEYSRIRRYDRNTLEFSRVVNLSDGVFAIVMTLLVFTLVSPEVTAEWSAYALFDHLPQLIVVMLSFALVANLWWQHHRFFEMIGLLEPGLIGINLLLLGTVALVPFPTNLIGNAPTSRAAVLPFIGLFIAISLLDLLLLIRARIVKAWRRPMSARMFYWLISSWIMGIIVMVIAFVLALWIPLAGLIILAISIVLGPLAAGVSRIAFFSSKGILKRFWHTKQS